MVNLIIALTVVAIVAIVQTWRHALLKMDLAQSEQRERWAWDACATARVTRSHLAKEVVDLRHHIDLYYSHMPREMKPWQDDPKRSHTPEDLVKQLEKPQ